MDQSQEGYLNYGLNYDFSHGTRYMGHFNGDFSSPFLYIIIH